MRPRLAWGGRATHFGDTAELLIARALHRESLSLPAAVLLRFALVAVLLVLLVLVGVPVAIAWGHFISDALLNSIQSHSGVVPTLLADRVA